MGKEHPGLSLRGLQSRSAKGQNGQAAAKKEVSAVWSGGWMPENISGVPAGKSVFSLDIPLKNSFKPESRDLSPSLAALFGVMDLLLADLSL